jgi:hypothetical protein
MSKVSHNKELYQAAPFFIFTPAETISTQLFSRKIPQCSFSTSDMKLLDIFALQLLVGSSTALPSFSHESGNLKKRADSPFVGFDGCSPSQKNDIITAWGDAQKLATIPAEFNVAGAVQPILLPDPFVNIGSGCSGICKVGALEERFFGNTIGQDPAAAALVKSTCPPTIAM